ncbi:hypothetical protein AB0J83_40295 [Actinoplanes sp. NPDC049596]|uniref:hypothetical protein n=1 Tax=unclassified Actinoplanes TaxID=2626549 RepID=UPI00342FB75D
MTEPKDTVPSLIASAWRGSPPVLRRFAGWMWGLGLPAAAVSIAGDLAGWWEGLQFVPNIVSEVISAMVALPVALVIIGQLAEYQLKELEKARLRSRFAGLREQLVTAARTTRERIEEVTQDVEATTDEFLRAAKIEDGLLADPAAANEAVRTLHTQMDGRQWLMYQRIVTPLRILGTHLQTLLIERDRAGDLSAETTRYAELWLDLESALAALQQLMAAGSDLFGSQVLSVRNVARADRLRDMAVDHLRAIDRLKELCRELEHHIGGETAIVTP